ncbi:hypothetical protein KKF38_00895 [Patescibacteria group bacterium]|nr:hypothetical protein [Patescibacteria group bacterium]
METQNCRSQAEAARKILLLLDQAEKEGAKKEGGSSLPAATALDKGIRFGFGGDIGKLRTNVNAVLKAAV